MLELKHALKERKSSVKIQESTRINSTSSVSGGGYETGGLHFRPVLQSLRGVKSGIRSALPTVDTFWLIEVFPKGQLFFLLEEGPFYKTNVYEKVLSVTHNVKNV